MALTLPSLTSPALDPRGYFSTAWVGFFTRLAGGPGPIATVAVGPSPFVYTAPGDGALAVVGGTISSITLARGRVTVSVAPGSVPLSQGDQVAITYSAAPALAFIPRTA